jgi:glutathione S-transferase
VANARAAAVTLRLDDHVASRDCSKVRLLRAQLGRPYECVPVDVFAGETLADCGTTEPGD